MTKTASQYHHCFFCDHPVLGTGAILGIIVLIIIIVSYAVGFTILKGQDNSIRMSIKQIKDLYYINPDRFNCYWKSTFLNKYSILTRVEYTTVSGTTFGIYVHWYSYLLLTFLIFGFIGKEVKSEERDRMEQVIKSALKDIENIEAQAEKENKEAQDIISGVANRMSKEK